MSTPSYTTSPSGPLCPRLRHILTGSFNTPFLHLLRFDSLTRSLTILLSVPALGPHQYLAAAPLGVAVGSTAAGERVVYATTWAEQSHLSAWRVSGLGGGEGGMMGGPPRVELINVKPIVSAGSYLAVREQQQLGAGSSSSSLSRPRRAFLYQAGGPTGEVFELDFDDGSNTNTTTTSTSSSPSYGGIGKQVQDLIFVDQPASAELDKDEEHTGAASARRIAQDSSIDKTRKGLRYGAHSVEFDAVHGLAYVAHLGRNAILVYSVDPQTGELTFESEAVAPGEKDGPRHAVPSRDGKWVFSVTEHTSYIDAHRLHPATSSSTPPRLEHVQRLSLLSPGANTHDYRGDTVRLSPSGRYVVGTTRGGKPGVKGWVRGWRLAVDEEEQGGLPMREKEEWAYETSTSGGKANAWEWASSAVTHQGQPHAVGVQDEDELAVLTDDERGYVSVMRWKPTSSMRPGGADDAVGISEVARVQLPGGKLDDDDKERGSSCEGGSAPRAKAALSAHNGVTSEYEGASHAIWLD